MGPFELDGGMLNSEAGIEVAADRLQQGIITVSRGFDQVDGESGFGRAQGPDM